MAMLRNLGKVIRPLAEARAAIPVAGYHKNVSYFCVGNAMRVGLCILNAVET